MIPLSLWLAPLKQHRMRSFLSAAALAISMSLMVAVSGALSSLEKTAGDALEVFFGSTDLVAEPHTPGGLISPQEQAGLLADPAVKSLRLKIDFPYPMRDADDKELIPWPVRQSAIEPDRINLSLRPEIQEGRWLASAGEAVVSEELARRFQLNVGRKIQLSAPQGPLKLEVVGIAKKPDALWMRQPVVYLELASVQQWLDKPGHANRVEIELASGADAQAFLQRRKAAERPLRYQSAASSRERFQQALNALELLLLTGLSLGAVAALFLVVSTLCVGVTERQRQWGLLRAVGLRKQGVFSLVIFEGLLLGGGGAAAGCGLGFFWLWALASWKPSLFPAGIAVDPMRQLLLGGVVMGVSCLLAAWPAWLAASCDVLAAIGAESRAPHPRAILHATLWALVPWALGAWVWRGLGVHHPGWAIGLGLPLLGTGVFLMAPAVLWITDRLLAGLAARLLWLPSHLLRHQLTGQIWRSTTTAAGLMVGLSAMLFLQSHGRSVLKSWQLPQHFPDLVLLGMTGLEPVHLEKLRATEGLDPASILPVTWAWCSSPSAAAGQSVETVVFGIDLEHALGGADQQARIDLDYLEGSAAEAKKIIASERAVIVSELFAKQKNVHLNDAIDLAGPGDRRHTYKVAAIVRPPLADLMVRLFDIEEDVQSWTGASAVTSPQQLEEDFGPLRPVIALADLSPGTDASGALSGIQKNLRGLGILSALLRPIKEQIQKIFSRLLDALGSLAMGVLAITSIGVAQGLWASLRSRSAEIGVLRSIGLSRFGLIRLVAAEALLLGIAGSVLGAVAGYGLAHEAAALVEARSGWELEFEWAYGALGVGTGITVAAALAAAVLPALATARRKPLDLLQTRG